ncbi:Gp19/Gp15/Gp42 family protein [Pseudonocardia asaccharolytica]|uniref:Uncharacterized protein n=1 Tax=Pseudonocardia asaccharolytica DSM 44247 = NBRC 16224 TaxID=1123024 RepID=A0A511D3X3_9PSEU|nr:Gp19/Gp15/Gp42 family protein [Pseudonocardia asaccharolytica]GEL19357.1 hypothetical protein PA7_31940 [Pseudonocardia asaccharolytica DSM 44247 = NBRC 16224]
MSSYAQIEDVALRLDRPIPPTEQYRVQVLLDEAEVELALAAGDIAARIAAGKTTAERVRRAVCEMVLRVLRNPSGFRQQSVGPFSVTADRQVASGLLTVSRRERRLLGLRVGAATVSLSDADNGLAVLGRTPRRWPAETTLPLP